MIRPVLFPVSDDNIIRFNSTVSVFLLALGLLSVFMLATWIMLRVTRKELNNPKMYLALTAFVNVEMILLIRFGPTLVAVKGLILCMILLWASLSDIARHEVPDFITVIILILAFVGFETGNLPSMLIGASAVFVPQMIVSVIRPGKAIGGADIKISTALAFLLGFEKGIFAMLVGMLSGVIFMVIVRKVRKEKSKDPFALVPFLSFGALLAYCI